MAAGVERGPVRSLAVGEKMPVKGIYPGARTQVLPGRALRGDVGIRATARPGASSRLPGWQPKLQLLACFAP